MTQRISDEQRARLYGEENAADLDEVASQDWLVQNHVRYVLPWRVEDEEKLVAQFAAVRAAARRAALEEAAAACDRARSEWDKNCDRPKSEHSGPSYAAAVAGSGSARDCADRIRALAAQEVKP